MPEFCHTPRTQGPIYKDKTGNNLGFIPKQKKFP